MQMIKQETNIKGTIIHLDLTYLCLKVGFKVVRVEINSDTHKRLKKRLLNSKYLTESVVAHGVVYHRPSLRRDHYAILPSVFASSHFDVLDLNDSDV